jgi:Zn-dependent protease with chaperone function
MFSNFLYFIVALIIYTTSEIFNQDQSLSKLKFLSVLLLLIGFAGICYLTFRKLRIYADIHLSENTNYLVNKKITALSVLALIVFSIDIHVLKIRAILPAIEIFKLLPTLEAALFISFFFLHLVIIWYFAFPLQSRCFTDSLSKKDYIFSNAAFSLPAVIPWFFLSLLTDFIILIPYQPLKELLNSKAGEIGLIGIFLIVVSIWGPVFIKRMWRCKPLQPGYTRTRIEELCKKAGIQYADISEWDIFGGKMLTAGVMGFIGRFRYILITPALIRLLNEDELDAVILHEIGHIKKMHMLFYIIFLAGFMAINYMYSEPIMQLLYNADAVYNIFSLTETNRADAHIILVSISLIGIFLFYFRIIFGFFMRNFERQADLYAFENSHTVNALISTFHKIAFYSRQSLNKPSWHHYSMSERIEFLKKCEADPSVAIAHHSKVRKMIIFFFIFLVLVLGLSRISSF